MTHPGAIEADTLSSRGEIVGAHSTVPVFGTVKAIFIFKNYEVAGRGLTGFHKPTAFKRFTKQFS